MRAAAALDRGRAGSGWARPSLLVLALTVPLAFDARPLTVLSGSMEPALMTGDVIVVRKASAAVGRAPGTSSPSASRAGGG